MPENIAFLINDVARHLRRRFDQRARTIGVTRPQWRVLLTLSRNEGLNQTALAERLEVEPITLCRMIDRLVEAGLVERRADPGDRRAWRIHLTPSSRPLLGKLSALGDDVVVDAMAGLTVLEQEALRRALERVQSKLAALPRQEGQSNG